VRLVWIGDGSLLEPLRKRAAELGVSERVVLPGWQHNARSLLAGFDIFVLPSLYEGFPLAILEAMAARLPCIGSDVDGVGEAVIDGQTGFLCPPDNLELWTKRLSNLVIDETARHHFGQAAAVRHRQEFSLEAMARKTASIYELLACS